MAETTNLFEDELEDTLAQQQWLETQEFAEQQAETPQTASQPKELQPGGDPSQTMETTSAPNPNAPPPPPPPPPPTIADMAGEIRSFGMDWLAQPNRYLSDFATEQRKVSEQRLSRMEEEEQAKLGETLGKRGLDTVGGIGLEAQGRLSQRLQEVAQQDEAQMLELLATQDAMDRLRAGQFGIEAMQSGLPLEALELEKEKLGETQRQFDIGTGFSQQDLDLRAEQIRSNAQLEGRSLDLQQARDQAEQELRREEIDARLQMLDRELGQRESEFARSLGLDERQFMAQQDQFSEQQRLRREELSQQDDQFRLTLEDQQAARAVDTSLRTRSLDLQEQGMDADQAYREAALEQDAELKNRAMDLQQQGMDQEDAYRYAALEQDSGFRERALDLQEQGMDADEAFRYAEFDWRQEQANVENKQKQTALLIQTLMALEGLEGISSAQVQNILNEVLGGANGQMEPDPPNIDPGDQATWTDEYIEGNYMESLWDLIKESRDQAKAEQGGG